MLLKASEFPELVLVPAKRPLPRLVSLLGGPPPSRHEHEVPHGWLYRRSGRDEAEAERYLLVLDAVLFIGIPCLAAASISSGLGRVSPWLHAWLSRQEEVPWRLERDKRPLIITQPLLARTG